MKNDKTSKLKELLNAAEELRSKIADCQVPARLHLPIDENFSLKNDNDAKNIESFGKFLIGLYVYFTKKGWDKIEIGKQFSLQAQKEINDIIPTIIKLNRCLYTLFSQDKSNDKSPPLYSDKILQSFTVAISDCQRVTKETITFPSKIANDPLTVLTWMRTKLEEPLAFGSTFKIKEKIERAAQKSKFEDTSPLLNTLLQDTASKKNLELSVNTIKTFLLSVLPKRKGFWIFSKENPDYTFTYNFKCDMSSLTLAKLVQFSDIAAKVLQKISFSKLPKNMPKSETETPTNLNLVDAMKTLIKCLTDCEKINKTPLNLVSMQKAYEHISIKHQQYLETCKQAQQVVKKFFKELGEKLFHDPCDSDNGKTSINDIKTQPERFLKQSY